MGDLFRQAVSEVSALPEEAQDAIGRQLLDYVEKIRSLRRDIQEGLDSLERGEGRPLDLEEFLREARERHAHR
ncbi:MAG: hypothetical protein ACWA6X_03990 [Bauldia sp.]|jgi:Arc/MetJ-type ribon-helix-helix transcriptional regulator